jgi:hypothetical protein
VSPDGAVDASVYQHGVAGGVFVMRTGDESGSEHS